MNYHVGMFEWTHFRVQCDGLYILILVKNIIKNIVMNEKDSFNFNIKEGKTLEGDFQQKESSF
jgi:hypothetical protein